MCTLKSVLKIFIVERRQIRQRKNDTTTEKNGTKHITQRFTYLLFLKKKLR